jgi:exosortase/archaeosortase family protein
VLALVWALLVLSFSARLYDPLLHLVPLVVVLGMAALASSGSAASCRQDPLGWQLAVIGLLLPAQVLINRFLPTGFLAAATASVSAALLWMIGVPAYAQGNRIVMLDQVFAVDASCTGVNTISLCLATAVLLVLLLPPPGIVGLRTKAGSLLVLSGLALVFAFLVNVARVALLGLTSANPGPGAFAALRGFAFWHDGGGSHLFSLFSMCLVVGAYVLAQETGLRKRDSRRS